MKMLEEAGLIRCSEGRLLHHVRHRKVGLSNDVEFARFMVKDVGVATVREAVFFSEPAAGKDIIRFTFCKKEETLRAAEERLRKLHHAVAQS